MGTLANSKDPDEMQHIAVCAMSKTIFRVRNNYFLQNSTWDPNLINNRQSNTNCINMYGKIHQNTKG